MDQVQRKQLLELADFLDVLPEENLYMGDWLGHAHYIPDEDENGEHGSRFHTPKEAMECGTACCVAGWAAILNQKVWFETFGYASPTSKRMLVDDHCFCEFFGITRNAAIEICLGRIDNANSQEKAQEIREVVENGGEGTYEH